MTFDVKQFFILASVIHAGLQPAAQASTVATPSITIQDPTIYTEDTEQMCSVAPPSSDNFLQDSTDMTDMDDGLNAPESCSVRINISFIKIDTYLDLRFLKTDLY